MKYMIALALTLTMTACSSSSDSNKNDGPSNGPGAKPQNTTDYSQCGNYTPGGLDIDSNTWFSSERQGDFELNMYMQVENYNGQSYVHLTSQCLTQGRTLSAQVTARARVSYGKVEILEAAQRSEKIEEPGFKMNCNVNIQRASINYRFKGRCLELSQSGSNEKVVMIPQ